MKNYGLIDKDDDYNDASSSMAEKDFVIMRLSHILNHKDDD